MKLTILLPFVLLTLNVKSQTIYDFSTDPLTNGWTYYDNYSSSPNPGFEYDPVNDRIKYQLNTTLETSILHTQLPSTLSNNYCVTFQITPTDNNNWNTFFPLVLTPNELTGNDIHPWRQNPINSTTPGPMQNIDFLAVEAFGNEIRFIHREGAITNGSTIQAMNPPFVMQANYTYWVKLEVSNSTTVRLSVFQDAGFNTLLGSTPYTIPALDDMNHLYIANCNGNSSTTLVGYVDDYRVDICSGVGIESLQLGNPEKELVKIIDLMGRETRFQPNTPLIYIYSDGSTEKTLNITD